MGRGSRAIFLALACVVLGSVMVTIGPAGAVASSLTPTNRVIRWRGDSVTASINKPSKCHFESRLVVGSRCGSFYFSVNVPADYWNRQSGKLRVRINWRDRRDNFDLYLYRGKKLIKSSRRRGTTSERVSLRNPVPGTYRAIVVPVRVTRSGYRGVARLTVETPPPGAPHYPVPPSVSSNCSVDVTAELNAWIASVPDGSTLEFRKGCYRIEGSVLVSDRERLTFEGNGATFRAFEPGPPYPAWRDQWLLATSTDLVFRNMTIIGADPTPGTFDREHEFEAGIHLCGSGSPPSQQPVCIGHNERVLIENVNIYNTYGPFIGVGGIGGTPHRDITIRGGDHFGSGTEAVGSVDVIGLLIEGGRYEKIGTSVFSLEPHGGHGDQIENVTIRGTRVARFHNLFIPAAGNGYPPKINVLIENNVIEGEIGDRHPNGPGSDWPLIDVYGAGSWTIRGNDFARYRGTAFRFNDPTTATISCNRVRWITHLEDFDFGVGVNGGTTTITNNRFVGAKAVWAGAGDAVESGNALEDSDLPPECG